MTPSLRAMQTITDASFTRSLPTRWNTPPALSALGHDVRTDVPGGLVSGVARTVDPRDTTPAELVWRMPDVGGAGNRNRNRNGAHAPDIDGVQPSGTIQPFLTMRTAPLTNDSPSSAPQLPQALQTSGHETTPARQASPPGDTTPPRETTSARQTIPPRQTTPSRQPPPPSQTLPLRQTTSAPRTTPTIQTSVSTSAGQSPITASPIAASSISASPISASPDTAQTRQVPHDAASAVEARDLRPVPVDVTDGPAAKAPVPGVNAEPGTETLDSPPSSPISEPGSLLTPREARPGPDPLGSAPAVAPLVAQTPLPRSLPRPTTSRQQQPRPSSPSPTPSSSPPSSSSSLTRPLSSASVLTPAPVPAPTLPSALTVTRSTTSHVAPLISAARFTPPTAPISVLQAPTTPVDQPVHAIESILSTYSFVGPHGSSHPAVAIEPGPPDTRTITHPPPPHPAEPRPVPTSNVSHARSTALNPVTQIAQSDGPSAHIPTAHIPTAHVPTAHHATAHDPAALDSLARQLYGRFSRHLAGELLIDRERAQFLTDLT